MNRDNDRQISLTDDEYIKYIKPLEEVNGLAGVKVERGRSEDHTTLLKGPRVQLDLIQTRIEKDQN